MSLVTGNSLQMGMWNMDLISILALVVFLCLTNISVKTLRECFSDRWVRCDSDSILVLKTFMFVGIAAATNYSRRTLQKKEIQYSR